MAPVTGYIAENRMDQVLILLEVYSMREDTQQARKKILRKHSSRVL